MKITVFFNANFRKGFLQKKVTKLDLSKQSKTLESTLKNI